MLVEDASVDTSGSGAAEPPLARRFQRARLAGVQRGCLPRGREAREQRAGVRARARERDSSSASSRPSRALSAFDAREASSSSTRSSARAMDATSLAAALESSAGDTDAGSASRRARIFA